MCKNTCRKIVSVALIDSRYILLYITDYYIITGTSRGLGEAIATNLAEPGNRLFCISRSNNQRLEEIAREHGAALTQAPFDLNNIDDIKHLVNTLFQEIDLKHAGSLTLINNAGVIQPITTAEKYDPISIVRNISVNLTAPIIISGLFLQKTSGFNGTKRVINISSGAAKKPYYGWGAYCAAKAGFNLFSQSMRLEQKTKKFPALICTVDPYIIDTGMQAEIRSSKSEDFVDVERFVRYKKTHELMSPDVIAKRIIYLMKNNELDSDQMIDIMGFTDTRDGNSESAKQQK